MESQSNRFSPSTEFCKIEFLWSFLTPYNTFGCEYLVPLWLIHFLEEIQTNRQRDRDRKRETETDIRGHTEINRQTDRHGQREKDFFFVWLVGWLVGWFLNVGLLVNNQTISRTGPKTNVWQFYVLPHMRQRWEIMTSVSLLAGHIILTPTQPVGSGRPQWEPNPGPPHQESGALRERRSETGL